MRGGGSFARRPAETVRNRSAALTGSVGLVCCRFMPHITLPADRPGISALMDAYPEMEKPLNAFADVLMRGPSSLTFAEREMIATFVSRGNACQFCTACHAAIARKLLGAESRLVDALLADGGEAPVTGRMRALLVIADKVRQDGRLVTAEHVAAARCAGADDKAIHDTVLIAAAFCMFNRYVDGLATAVATSDYYERNGREMAARGYRRPDTNPAG
jgi:uncharacterized peroxidase-related enzyme